jgi:predicted secreted protein
MGSGASGTDHGNATFIPSDIVDAGSIEVEGFFAAGTEPPIDAAAEQWTITFPDTSTWVASGFMTDFSLNAPFDEKMTFSATIKLTGACNITSVA